MLQIWKEFLTIWHTAFQKSNHHNAWVLSTVRPVVLQNLFQETVLVTDESHANKHVLGTIQANIKHILVPLILKDGGRELCKYATLFKSGI